MMRLIALLVVSASVSACAHQPHFVPVGPPLVTYSQDFQAKAADELETVKACCPNVTRLLIDYFNLRNAVRAITKQDTTPKPLTPATSCVRTSSAHKAREEATWMKEP